MIEEWMRGYLSAWSSDDPDEIGALFAEDAQYFPAPWEDPIEGREAITWWWRDIGDSKNEWSFEYDVVAVDGNTAVVSGHTEYAESDTAGPRSGTEYYNLWVIRFAEDGRAREFTEWWMRPDDEPEAA